VVSAFDPLADVVFTSDGQMESIHPTQLRRMVQLGLIFHTAGRWRTELTTAELADRVASQLPVCDFCSRPDPVWDFPCADHEQPRLPGFERLGQISVGAWGACERCAFLIKTERWERLARRAFESQAREHPELRGHEREMLALIRALHRRFAANRTGPPERVEATGDAAGGSE
jgi:hypothetical protein